MSELLQGELHGKRIAYGSNTEFVIQLTKSRNRKSGFVTWRIIKGDLAQAMMYYQSLELHNGKRKRLLMPSAKQPVLARS